MVLSNYMKGLTAVKKKSKFILIIAIILGLITVLSLFSMYQGPAGSLLGITKSLDSETFSIIMFQIRLPRVLLALIVGFGLACCGVVLQAVLQNPLAEPFVLGTSAGAATIAVGGMVLGLTGFGLMLLFGGIGALLSTILVLSIARIGGRLPVYRLIVSGIIIHSFFSAILMMLISAYSDKTAGIMFWLMGSLANKSLWIVLFVGLIVFVCYLLIQFRWKELNLLSIGDEHAIASGVNVSYYKLFFIVVSTIMAGAIVAVSGIIGFVGIIVPHGMRMVLGSDHKYLIVASALSGSLFLLIADMLIRLFFDGTELPIGIITALSGAPFFLYLMYRNKSKVF